MAIVLKQTLADIDIRSCYHPNENATAIAQLRTALETIGIYRILILQSSWSEGLHCYIPLPEAVPTFDWAATLKGCLLKAGFTLKSGTLELFPNCKAYSETECTDYQGHRLPLQPGSGSILLDDHLLPLPFGTDLGYFLQAWDNAAAGQDMDTLRASMEQAKADKPYRHYGGSSDTTEWKQNLETVIAQGWTGRGQTNDLLKVIANYGITFKHLKGKALIDFMVATAIAAPGYQEYCAHHHEIRERCQHWAKSAEKFYWPLGTQPIVREVDLYAANKIVPLTENARRATAAQERIRQAVEQGQAQGTLPDEVTARLNYLIKAARTSPNTLYKYPALWYPEELRSLVTARREPDSSISGEGQAHRERSPEAGTSAKLQTLPPNEGCIGESGSVGSCGSQPTGRPGLSEICPDRAVEVPEHQDQSDCRDAIAAVENSAVGDMVIAQPTSTTGDSDLDLSRLAVPQQFSPIDAEVQAIADATPPEALSPEAVLKAGMPEPIAHPPPVNADALSHRDSEAWITWSYYQQAIRAECDRLQLDAQEWTALLRRFHTRLLTALSSPQMQQLLETLRQIPDF